MQQHYALSLSPHHLTPLDWNPRQTFLVNTHLIIPLCASIEKIVRGRLQAAPESGCSLGRHQRGRGGFGLANREGELPVHSAYTYLQQSSGLVPVLSRRSGVDDQHTGRLARGKQANSIHRRLHCYEALPFCRVCDCAIIRKSISNLNKALVVLHCLHS